MRDTDSQWDRAGVMDLYERALRLHRHIQEQHWNGQSITGPDPGIRINARIGRFIKNYLSFWPWSDNLTYMQAQGYWILANWQLFDLTAEPEYREIALACSEYVLAVQRPEGCWDYPNPEWRGRIATVEGCFAALGLLESYARVGHEPFLAGAKKWYRFLVDGIGFRAQPDPRMLAVNYFAHESGDSGGVPNNSTLALWTIARLAELSNDKRFLDKSQSMVRWLDKVQLKTGELPYAVGSRPEKDRPHFLCYQYNAFELLDLIHYFRITEDRMVLPIMQRLAGFLSSGLTGDGAARFDCHHNTPEVAYYTIAVGHALSQAGSLGLAGTHDAAEQAFRHALSAQRQDGAFRFYSRSNYRFLSDRRSYPRYLAMILSHLLQEHQLPARPPEPAGIAETG